MLSKGSERIYDLLSVVSLCSDVCLHFYSGALSDCTPAFLFHFPSYIRKAVIALCVNFALRVFLHVVLVM